jgi:hypothetical protein
VGDRLSIRDLYAKTIDVTLPDGSSATFARMTVRLWAKLAEQIRERRVRTEMKAIDAYVTANPAKKPEDRVINERIRQDLRMRADQFEPSYYALIDSAQTPSGIADVLPFCAIEGGTSADLANELIDILGPQDVTAIMMQIVHAPLGAKIGGDVKDGQSPNPTSAASSSPATGTSDSSPGSESPSMSSTGAGSDGKPVESTASTSTV